MWVRRPENGKSRKIPEELARRGVDMAFLAPKAGSSGPILSLC